MPQTLLSMLKAGAAASAGAPALIERRGEAFEPVSHEALAAAIDAAALTLSTLGLGPGDVIGLWLPNSLDYLALQFAAATASVEVLGINTRYGAFELEHILRTARPKLVALPYRFLDLDFTGRLTAAFDNARKAEPGLKPPSILVCGGAEAAGDLFNLGGGSIAFDLTQPAPPLTDRGRPEATACYFTTSGSTGSPKLAGHDQASMAMHAPLAASTFGIGPRDVVLGVLPFCGVFGFNVAMATLASGASLLVEPVFDPRSALSAMARFGATHVFGGDDLWGRLHEAWLDQPVDLSSLRRGSIAQFEGRAEPLAAWAREQFGAELTGLYGSSELLSFALTRPTGLEIVQQVRGGGRPLCPDIEFRIGDPEAGAVGGLTEGELQVRGFNRITHYLGNPDATARAITGDGWFRTGDLARDDGDGGYTFLCRNSEALRLRGFLVEPAEIEQCLRSHPGVEAARVVGVRTQAGDRPVGFVKTTAADVTGADLEAFCKGRLAAFKLPARIVVLREFPVTVATNGVKIRLEELKRRAQVILEEEGLG